MWSTSSTGSPSIVYNSHSTFGRRSKIVSFTSWTPPIWSIHTKANKNSSLSSFHIQIELVIFLPHLILDTPHNPLSSNLCSFTPLSSSPLLQPLMSLWNPSWYSLFSTLPNLSLSYLWKQVSSRFTCVEWVND